MTLPLADFLANECGATAIEYGFLAAVLAAVAIPAASILGAGASEALAELSARLAPAGGPPVRLR